MKNKKGPTNTEMNNKPKMNKNSSKFKALQCKLKQLHKQINTTNSHNSQDNNDDNEVLPHTHSVTQI